MKKHLSKRLLALVLVVALCAGFTLPVSAAGSGDYDVTFEKVDNGAVSVKPFEREEFVELEKPSLYSTTSTVRVSIVLSDASTIEKVGTTENLAANTTARLYRSQLAEKQAAQTSAISAVIGEDLDVVWNLTLAANIISANVEYGQIKAIEKVPGVEKVVVETRYEPAVVDTDLAADPNMSTSSEQTGATAAWAGGYTGAGSRIAVIDTGIDTDHQSFDEGAFLYSLKERVGEENIDSLNLLDANEISEKLDQLNVVRSKGFGGTADDLYRTAKIPFGFNYVDKGLDITHDHDTASEHGSHVEGIAAANAYIPDGNGGYANALETVKVQGVAPDAQIITMKVFGKGGGAYDSDYMAAIEDAIILGADSINLSLGSANPGASEVAGYEYQGILDSLTEKGAVVAISAGNSGGWADNAYNLTGYLYGDDVSMDTVGSPGSYTNSLAVASVDNAGLTGSFVTVDGHAIFYTETTSYTNQPFTTVAGEREYIYIDGYGTADDWAAVGEALKGKIALCSRGSISFYEKGDNAAEAGAIATIIYNNAPGVINMDLSGYSHTQPCVSITQEDGALIKAASTPVTDDEGNVLYYTGKMSVPTSIGSTMIDSDYYTMSDFSSWGVPGSLKLKPEITAPGGNIYSVNGAVAGGQAYENMSGTSMAAPQVTGMAALVAQYIRDNGLEEKTGLTVRQLTQSLLMSTAVPLFEDHGEDGDGYYSVLKQGAGLANVGAAITADSYILVGADATDSYADGKVKAELGDDPEKKGVYSFSFSIHNLTDEALYYDLAADLFTQDLFPYYVNQDGDVDSYLDTWTTPLNAAVTWTVDGKTVTPEGAALANMDFNGDGKIDNQDCTALLEYITGVRTAISHAENADLDNDGDIDSYDAYLFLKRFNAGAVTVPANGSVDVTVTMELLDDLDAYTTGAYVEGYVYAKAITTAEGAQGTTHSIPVLGYYGDWSAPSMFDKGSYLDYTYGGEVRVPYLGSPYGNTFAVTYDGESSAYYFGGNPWEGLVHDETYHPERNAINSRDKLSKVGFAAIRNAAASRFLAYNETAEKVLKENLPGPIDSAFYYANYESWQNASQTISPNVSLTSASEGDKLNFSLTLAPEYFVDGEGNVAWDSLGDGATFSVPAVVDNTAPEIEDVLLSFEHNQLIVSAKDNEYISAVILFNGSGSKYFAAAGSKESIAPGESANYVLDLSKANGSKFLVQVYDYAMNVSTYVLKTQIGEEEPLPGLIAFDLDANLWTSISLDAANKGLSVYADSEYTFYAATIVDHIVFASTKNGDLYVMPENDLTDTALVGNLGTVLIDMAYNKADGQIYGVTADNMLVTVDKLTGELTEVREVPVETNTLACDADGIFYCNYYDGASGKTAIYKFTRDGEGEKFCDVFALPAEYVQAMEISPNDGKLYWSCYLGVFGGYSPFFEIDMETGAATLHGNMNDELSCLIIPEKTGSSSGWNEPTDTVSSVQITDSEIDLLVGASVGLTASVKPWTVTNREVTWTSADESIATVNSKGVVTGVSKGTTTVTATSVLDPTKSATCTVNVTRTDVTLVAAVQDTDGTPVLASWNMAEEDSWTPYAKLDTDIANAAFNWDAGIDGTNYVYQQNTKGMMYVVDPETGKTVEMSEAACAFDAPMQDMDIAYLYSEEAGVPILFGVYSLTVLANIDDAGNPYRPVDNKLNIGWNLSTTVSLNTPGATKFVALAWGGVDRSEGYTPADMLFALTDNGYMWVIYYDGTGSVDLSYFQTDLRLDYPDYGGQQYNSMIMGDDGNVYLSHFTGETNELYQLQLVDPRTGFVSQKIGDFGDGVWPAALLAVQPNENADDGSSVGTVISDRASAANVFSAAGVSGRDVVATVAAGAVEAPAAVANSNPYAKAHAHVSKNAVEEASKPEMEKVITGGLNAVVTTGKSPVRPMSDTTVTDEEDTIILDVTAKDGSGKDVASTNGKMTVTYDSDIFTLKSVTVHAGYWSYNDKTDGKVVVAYADLDAIPAGASVATLVLERKANGAGSVSVLHEQVNDGNPGYNEVVPIHYSENPDDHSETILVGAKDPTWTEPGYTGDVVCAKCGTVLKKGTVIPPLGIAILPVVPDVPSTITKPTAPMPFTDVSTGDWFYDAVKYVYEEGLMNGTSDTKFSPSATLTRGMVVTILYRLEGKPATRYNARFSDVPDYQWYTDGVEWAVKNGIVNGYGNGKFGPEDPVTREQLTAILYRYAQYKNYGVTKTADLSAYTDSAKVSEYAVPAVKWAAANGILESTNGALRPTESATRAEVAAAVAAFHQKYVK